MIRPSRLSIVAPAALAAFALAASPAPAVPPPPRQQVANCNAPTYASDQLVCATAELRVLDGELAALLPPRATPGLDLEPQDAWFRRSRMCAMKADHLACLRAAYRERMAVLRAAARFDPSGAPWRADRCGKSGVELAELPGGVVAVRKAGTITLANAGTELASWTPWAWVATSGQRYSVHWLSGGAAKCRVVYRR